MTLLISSDLTLVKYNECIYIKNYDYDFYNVYLGSFDKIILCCRVQNFAGENFMNYTILDNSIYSIIELPNFRGYSGLINNFVKIFKILKKSKNIYYDYTILRLPSISAFLVYIFFLSKKKLYCVELVADPSSLYKVSSNIIESITWRLINILLKLIINKAHSLSFVTSKYLQKIYMPKNSKVLNSFYSSIILKNDFFFNNRKINKPNFYQAVHISNAISTYNKGHIETIEIVKKVNKQINLKCVFIGDGTLVNDLKIYASKNNILDKIDFIGYKESSEIKSILKNSHIMIFPSKSEGLPRVIIEAMACGLPCCSYDVGGVSELLNRTEIFPINDIEFISDRIIKILTDEKLYQEISDSNFKKSLMYSNDAIQKRRTEFYNKIKNEIN